MVCDLLLAKHASLTSENASHGHKHGSTGDSTLTTALDLRGVSLPPTGGTRGPHTTVFQGKQRGRAKGRLIPPVIPPCQPQNMITQSKHRAYQDGELRGRFFSYMQTSDMF